MIKITITTTVLIILLLVMGHDIFFHFASFPAHLESAGNTIVTTANLLLIFFNDNPGARTLLEFLGRVYSGTVRLISDRRKKQPANNKEGVE